MTYIRSEDWPKRAYRELCYAFMLRGTIDWYLWGGGWDVIENAPADVLPALPVEPNWPILPDWVNWWAIDGDGHIKAFHFKPMGSVERRVWFLGAHGPPHGDIPVEIIAGSLGEPVTDWFMAIRRRPAHIDGASVAPAASHTAQRAAEKGETPPTASAKGKAKRKKKVSAE